MALYIFEAKVSFNVRCMGAKLLSSLIFQPVVTEPEAEAVSNGSFDSQIVTNEIPNDEAMKKFRKMSCDHSKKFPNDGGDIFCVRFCQEIQDFKAEFNGNRDILQESISVFLAA